MFFLAFALAVSVARASTFSVSPTQLYLDGGNASTELVVINQSDGPVTLSAAGYSWAATPSGAQQLKASNDIIVFPGIFTLLPLQQQTLRVGVTASATATEQAYRIIVQELPPPLVKINTKGVSVRVLTAFSVPLFLSPISARTEASLANARIVGGHLEFEVHNDGTVHIMPSSATVVAKDAAGHSIWSHDVSTWYVLAGDVLMVSVALPPAVCEQTRSVWIGTNGTDVKTAGTFEDLQAHCR